MRTPGLNRLLYKAMWLWLALFLSHTFCFSQTTNINGIVNTYHKVIDLVPSKACVLVGDPTGLIPGKKVLLIQMKGATIDTSTNLLGFGDILGLNDAGNYEVATICAIKNDSVFFVNTILNSYSIAGKVQLVQFGEYFSANVTGVVQAAPWNNTTGTGGVIAIFAEQDIILNDNINADVSGLRGGLFFQNNNNCTNSLSNYYYVPNPTLTPFNSQNGAYKGEGITDFSIAKNGGRGAPANGGGGGNNHNNSGGGGANLGAGGIGGGNSSSSSGGCNAAFPGEGGKPLNSWSGQKIFLGGGGGAGHNNNAATTTQGANGGGIIFIHANNLIGNNRLISASGGQGGNAASDGAGGGGGGGTIIMDVVSYSGAVIISADGGHGGNSENGLNSKRCYAGGGGGGGGAIYMSGSPAVIASVNGGGHGLETGRDPLCNAPVVAGDGVTGSIINNYSYRASTTLANYCSTVLPVRLISFKATRIGKSVILHWQLPNAEEARSFIIERMTATREWTALQIVPANDLQQDYTAEDNTPLPGYNYYRIKMNQKNNSVLYSSVRQIFTGDEGGAFSVYPNPVIDKIIIRCELTGPADIRLHDASGKLVFQKKIILNSITQINMPRLIPGIYSLHINQKVEKIIVK